MINLQKKMQSLSVGRELDAYTGVRISVGQDSSGAEVVYFAGDETGYVLDIENPLGSQQMAEAILSILVAKGGRYQPFDAGSAMLDPAAEIGDGVTVDGTISAIMAIKTRHGRLMAADISAPYDEEVDHEFKYEPKTQREFKRESAYSRARLTLTESEIAAKVSIEGGDPQSFEWKLRATGHAWYADGSSDPVVLFNRNGAYIKGEIHATSGVIGDAEIINGHLTVDGASIKNLNADYITVGYLSVDRLSANSIGGDKIGYGTITGGGQYGNVAQDTLSTWNTDSGTTANIGYGAAYHAATVSAAGAPDDFYATNFRATRIYANTYLYAAAFQYGNKVLSLQTKTIGGVTINYLGYE